MEQMFEHAKQHGHRFMAACNYAPIGAPKMYASYPACEDFITETLLKTEKKHFYELIPEGQPCKFFLNMECVEPHDPAWQRKLWLLSIMWLTSSKSMLR